MQSHRSAQSPQQLLLQSGLLSARDVLALNEILAMALPEAGLFGEKAGQAARHGLRPYGNASKRCRISANGGILHGDLMKN